MTRTRLTPQQVVALAPDASAAKAAQGLASPRTWSGLGRDDRAVWGLCRGSGQRPYQTQVDLPEPAFRCSCPSRKLPCKHALGLLLLWASTDEVPVAAARPEWVEEWLVARDRRAERAAERAERPARPPDPEAQARRAAQREERVAAGVDELRRWLRDLVRRGLAEAQRESWRFWEEPAARMVDAQAAGLAARVRRMGSSIHAGREAWAERLLEEAALLQLLLEAHDRLDVLPEATREDVRQLIGWTVPAEQVLGGERIRDAWAVVGQVVTEDDRLRSQRTWLRGERTGREALVLAFAPPGQPLDPGVVFGTVVEADVVFYPGAAPVRALVADRHAEPAELDRLPGGRSVADALAARAAALARNPWTDRFPVALRDVVPARGGGRWALVDGDGGALALEPRVDPWELAALSGGHPIDVFGELEGDALGPLTAAADGRVVAL